MFVDADDDDGYRALDSRRVCRQDGVDVSFGVDVKSTSIQRHLSETMYCAATPFGNLESTTLVATFSSARK